ncbi:hypothetical protein, partial [Streptomyces sp. URMC 129]|uniref:hypothetical protein n=1 Tax=Streptomyces sp. URMC 129 TaxID=3423407 RepID=UPI003F1AC506
PPPPFSTVSSVSSVSSVQGSTTVSDEPLPPPGLAEVRITAASAQTAREIAATLRRRFAVIERHGHADGDEHGAVTVHLTVDTTCPPEGSGPFRPRLVTGPPPSDEV